MAWTAAVDERLADPAERLSVLFDAHHQRLDRVARRAGPTRRATWCRRRPAHPAFPAIAKLLAVAPVRVRWHLSRGHCELAAVIRQQESEELKGQDRRDGRISRDGHASCL